MASRLRGLLPARWFPDPGQAPVLEALLGGLGAAWAAVFSQILFAQAQTRLRTVSGGFLDMAAADFRGPSLRRRPGESDDKLRARLLPIFRDKATRAALSARLLALTGAAPWIFEPSRPADTGAYGAGPGVRLGGILPGPASSPVASTAVAAPVAGAPVFRHAAPVGGDTNTGYFLSMPLAPGTGLAATASVYLPAGYTGGAPQLSLEGGLGGAVSAPASTALLGQWQVLSVSGTATRATPANMVLRAAGAGGSGASLPGGANTFYSSAWGAVSGAAPIPPTNTGRGLAGGYGSLKLPNQLFVTAQRPTGQGIPLVAGYGSRDPAQGTVPAGGYGTAGSAAPQPGVIEWAALASEAAHVTDADLYALIADVMPAASIAWTALGGAPPGGVADLGDFMLDVNILA